jgi:ribosome-binding ATPase YchF (GTP1/OBG family)
VVQNKASKAFYRDTLGFEVRAEVGYNNMYWITGSPTGQRDVNIVLHPLPDSRLARLAEIFSSERILPATVSFVDIAGIVKGASEGEGMGNQFLANIREAEAICQVVRVFADDDVVHVDGRVDPVSDIEVIETELILADMQTLEKALPRLEKDSRKNKDLVEVVAAAQAAQKILDEGKTLFSQKDSLDFAKLRELHLMTTKPFLYVFNADESVLTDPERIA